MAVLVERASEKTFIVVGLGRIVHALQVIVFLGKILLMNDIVKNGLWENSHLSLCISRHSKSVLKMRNSRETLLIV